MVPRLSCRLIHRRFLSVLPASQTLSTLICILVAGVIVVVVVVVVVVDDSAVSGINTDSASLHCV